MADRVTRTVRMAPDLAERIDNARQGVPFEAWARGVFERALGESHQYRQGYGPDVSNVRDSASVKRNIDPIPKGAKK